MNNVRIVKITDHDNSVYYRFEGRRKKYKLALKWPFLKKYYVWPIRYATDLICFGYFPSPEVWDKYKAYTIEEARHKLKWHQGILPKIDVVK